MKKNVKAMKILREQCEKKIGVRTYESEKNVK